MPSKESLNGDKLTLYLAKVDSFSPAVEFLVKANKIPYEIRYINLNKGDQNSEEFKKINPLGKVPAITHGDFSLFETNTILRYICNAQPVEDFWYPKDPVKKAKIDIFFDWWSANLEKFDGYVMNQFGNKKQEVVDESKAITNKIEKDLETIFLSKHKFIADDNVTIADLTVVWHILMGMIVKSEYSSRLN